MAEEVETVEICVRVPARLRKRLEEEAARRGATLSELVRSALIRYLAEAEKEWRELYEAARRVQELEQRLDELVQDIDDLAERLERLRRAVKLLIRFARQKDAKLWKRIVEEEKNSG